MVSLVALAVVLLLATLWWLARPLRAGAPVAAEAVISERAELALLRNRLVTQLGELDAERADRGMDAASAADEEARLSAELAGVLKRLDALPAAPGSGDRAAATTGARLPAVLALGVTLLAGAGLYGWQNAENLQGFMLAAKSGANSARVPPMVFEMVAKLEQRLQDSPNDADGWARLGRAYAVMERTDDALAAYERAYALAPDNAAVLADYAWLLFNRDPGQTTGRVNELYARLYQLDARNPDALWFLGFAAYQQGEFRKATGFWERLLKMVPPEDPGREHLQQAIASARAKAAGR
jgi:cytochrome c-type biogenesis protein CcmH